MRKLWLCLSIGLLLLGSLKAEYYPPIFDLEIGVGYRHDNYKMQMKAFKRNPVTNFGTPSKELWRWAWREIEIIESSATLRYTTCLNYYFRFNGDWGRIHNGEGHVDGFARLPCDKEFNVTSSPCSDSSFDTVKYKHFSRIKNKSNRGSVMDFSGAVGYQFRSNGRRTIITPLLGFSYHHQRLEFHHAKQVIDAFDPFPVLGKIPDLHVQYKPRWYGPFIGVDVEAQVDIPCVLFFVSAEYHWKQFRTTGSWNFADAFIHEFNQHSHGHGTIIQGGVSYKLQCNFWITAFGTWRNFYCKHGNFKTTHRRNRLLFPDQTFGTFPFFNKDRDKDLNSFQWNSWVAGLAFDWRY